MEAFYVVAGLVFGLVTLFIITRPFTVLFHELGHAIPYLLLTKYGATIYIGSYGNKEQSFKIIIAKLEIWLRYNPLKWNRGLCVSKEKSIPLNIRTVSAVGGVLLSLLISFILFYIVFSYDMHGSLKLISVFVLGLSVFDLFVNLIPNKFKTSDGKIFLTDGAILFRLQKLKKFPAEYDDAIEKYNNKEYEQAAGMFNNFIQHDLVSEDIYRLASNSYLLINNYSKAFELQKEFENKYELTSDDYYNMAYASIFLKSGEEDLYLKKSLEKNPDNVNTLNAIGYNLNQKGKFSEAILILDKAINIQNDCAYAYNNRGHAKIEIGQLDEGLHDIQHSLQLDNKNSYAYRNLGIYYLEKNEKESALKYFLQAKEIDAETDLIDEYINKATTS